MKKLYSLIPLFCIIFLLSSCSLVFPSKKVSKLSINVDNLVKSVSRNASEANDIYVTVQLVSKTDPNLTITETKGFTKICNQNDNIYATISESVSGEGIDFNNVPYGMYDIKAYICIGGGNSGIKYEKGELPYKERGTTSIPLKNYLPYSFFAEKKSQLIDILTKNITIDIDNTELKTIMLSLPYGDETNVTLNEHSFISFDERDGFVQMGFRDTDGVILGAKDGKTSNGKNTYIPFNKIIPVSDLVGICDTNSQFSLCYTGYTKGELSTPLITYTTTGTEINFYQDDSSDPFATISASEDETIELLDYTFDDSANLYILVWIGGENAYKVYKYTNTKEGYKVANEETDIYSFNDEFEPQCLAYDPYKQKLYAYTEGTSGETNTPILYYDVFTMNQLENNDSGLKILYDDTVIEKRTWRVVWVKGQPCLVVNAVSNKTENNTRTTSLVIKGKQAENGTPLDEATDYSQQSIHLESLNISWEKLTLEDVVSVGDAVYILCSANDSDNSSRKFSAGGFVIKLNADSNSFTIDESFGNDGFLGWQERDPATPNGTIIINYQSASPSYSYQWLMFGPTEENPQNVFIGPRKIVAIKPNELFIADAAFFMAGTANSDSDWKKERKSRIVKISKNGKSFGVTKTLDQDKEYFITE